MCTVTSATGCGGDLTAPSGGPVTSPNYPGNYGNNENCEWLITVPEGSIIILTFDSFDTEERWDFLTIYDGASDNAKEIKKLTGRHSQISPIISTSNTMFLRFTSSRRISHQGFQFNYTSSSAGQCWDPGVPANGNRDNNSNFTSGQTVRYTCMDGYQLRGTANITCQPDGTWNGATPTCEVTSVTGCGGNLTASSGGPVTSPNYPGNYGNNENCEWLITVPEGSIIRLTFDSFNTEFNRDYLTIYDGASDNAPELKELTGDQSQIIPIISTSNTMFLRFTSNKRVRRQGFQFSYTNSSRIRLVDGPNEGVLEVRPADSWTWGRVCAEHFDLRDADVVCRMLGYIWANGFSIFKYGSSFVVSHRPRLAYMADLQCNGNESSLFDCSYAGWGIHDCQNRRYSGVVCGVVTSQYFPPCIYIYVMIYLDPSRIRLIGGSGPNEGRVEVRPEDSVTWGTVCHNRFNMDDADVVCRMLGYPNATQVRNDAYFGQGTGPIYMDDVRCDGNETSLFSCSYAGWTIHDCDHGQDAGVVCRTYSSRIRLVGGSGPNEGRVEVRPADSPRWGTVCHNGFDLKDAEVVCRMLGYPNVYGVRPYEYFVAGTGPIYMEDLQCDGTESSLFNCSHKGWGIHDCEHSDVVGVVCDHIRIRLVGGSSRKEGRVEVRPADSMTWGTVCHNQFDIKDADVVCKMLGYPSAQLVRNDAYFGQGRGPIYMDDLHCTGDENSLFNCSYPGWTIHDLNCNYDQAAGVECTAQPFLLVTTEDGIFQIEVKDGSKVNVLSGWHLSLDYDPMTDFMYWTTDEGIERARRDGSRLETIVEFETNTYGRSLRLDHAGGNVYWSDNVGHISVARKDGSFVRTLLTLQGFAERLVLDPRNGLMYWVSNRDSIDRAAMDGSNHTTIIRNLTLALSIAIDYTENRLYYSDREAIYSSDMLGNNTQLVNREGERVPGIAPVPRPMEDVGSFALRIQKEERAPAGIYGNCRRMD
ncbi:PREDICTED: deleted in malignant brain tumors 1 protein-like [Branchiostoma belcheri]|uniref:Deleted in malignant brain tumors 1 protein-like n=1 Tax=Branchiostoma belcheri TaxID=7741 RepID=A0A6P4XVT5_BRABE|nr:PREDICTED: deleted in malignant brain tumors 1 protein-like [Branchiostoma belcheri]